MQTLDNYNFAGKKAFVRVDFNVPLNDKGEITDDTRITASLPTIQYLLEQKAAVILMAHLGRPKGQVKPELSLAPVAKHLGKLLGKKILFAPDCVGEAAQAAASKLKPGHILLLENLRFHKEEEKNDMEFAEKLASLADLYVNDGFGVSHRAHASVEGVTHFLPAAAGFLLEKEIQYVGQAVTNPLHPFVAIIGGAKVSDKIGVISNLLDKVDTLLIGGGMANTFLAAQGYKMGKSLVEEDKLDLAKELLAKAKKNKVNIDFIFLYTYNEYMSNRSYKEKNMLNDDQVIDLSELFKIFGDSTRIKIINCLLEKELCVSEIAELTNSTQSAISHQLRILKQSKLVKYRKEGQSTIYSLADDHVEKIFRVGVEHIDEI